MGCKGERSALESESENVSRGLRAAPGRATRLAALALAEGVSVGVIHLVASFDVRHLLRPQQFKAGLVGSTLACPRGKPSSGRLQVGRKGGSSETGAPRVLPGLLAG